MNLDELHARAVELGVEIEHHDINGAHRARPDVLERVVAILEDDRAAVPAVGLPAVGLPPVVLGARAVVVDGAVSEASLVVGGIPVDVPVRRAAGSDGDRSVLDVPRDLPVGCHPLALTTAHGPAESLVVVAPPTMWRTPRLDGGVSLFVPAYALWERADPLPSFGHLGTLAAALPSRGIEAVATLPLYATFLDDPFDPSPYSPISRLHWNEVFLTDAGLPAAPVPELGDMIDWRALGERRRRQLLSLAAAPDPALARRLETLLSAHPDVGAYARFRAARDRQLAPPEVTERSHVLAQLLADEQLEAIRRPTATGEPPASLALDLPVGSHPAGYETWAYPALFAHGMAVGAPPDPLFDGGQNWGFPPPLPSAMRNSGYRLWRDMIARAGARADVLRIDHVMAVQRLWWVPDGVDASDGVYVRYPRDELLAVIAASAAAAEVTIVGEDLGTVSPEVRDALDRWDVIGMHEEQFFVTDHALPHIPTRSVAGIRTHDMPAFASYAAEHDLSGYRHLLATSLEREVDDTPAGVLDALLERLARSGAYLVSVDLDDLVGETRPHNLPGRVVPGIWQRRLDRPASEVLDDPNVRYRCSILGRTRP